jgi:hypothetical protein
MARFVMISIPDNKDADQLVAAIERGDFLFGYDKDNGDGTGEYGYKAPTDAKVEAVWAKPTKFCECTDWAGVSAPTTSYRWMVHAKCAKPRKGVMQHPKDLTRVDTPANEIPFYLGFRADCKGWRIPREKK